MVSSLVFVDQLWNCTNHRNRLSGQEAEYSRYKWIWTHTYWGCKLSLQFMCKWFCIYWSGPSAGPIGEIWQISSVWQPSLIGFSVWNDQRQKCTCRGPSLWWPYGVLDTGLWSLKAFILITRWTLHPEQLKQGGEILMQIWINRPSDPVWLWVGHLKNAFYRCDGEHLKDVSYIIDLSGPWNFQAKSQILPTKAVTKIISNTSGKNPHFKSQKSIFCNLTG